MAKRIPVERVEWQVPISLEELKKASDSLGVIIDSFVNHTVTVATELSKSHPILSAGMNKIVSLHLQEMAYLLQVREVLNKTLVEIYFVVKDAGQA